MASSVTTSLSRPPPEIVRGQSFDVGPRYHSLNYIGEGAYGMVWYVPVLAISISGCCSNSPYL